MAPNTLPAMPSGDQMTRPLADRTAIVTGGTRGLGLEIARSFVAAGAGVVVTGRDQAALDAAAAELGVEGIRADVSDGDACAAVVSRAEARFGPVTVLVNNAGVYGPMGPIETIDWDAWVEAIHINLFGTVLMCRAVVPQMRARGYGKIINLSGGGATAPMPRISAYAASKAAVVRVTETISEELRDAGVDVNAIAPGALNTRMLDQLLEAGPERVGAAAHAKARRQRDDGGAAFEPAVRLAVFLASAASDGISGRLLSALWDAWETLPERREAVMRSDVYTLRRIVPEDRP
jgi:NAD(P)-dependent dehydrogenase (short-subunit alcohol dehydrogenase family)